MEYSTLLKCVRAAVTIYNTTLKIELLVCGGVSHRDAVLLTDIPVLVLKKIACGAGKYVALQQHCVSYLMYVLCHRKTYWRGSTCTLCRRRQMPALQSLVSRIRSLLCHFMSRSVRGQKAYKVLYYLTCFLLWIFYFIQCLFSQPSTVMCGQLKHTHQCQD